MGADDVDLDLFPQFGAFLSKGTFAFDGLLGSPDFIAKSYLHDEVNFIGCLVHMAKNNIV